MAENGEKKKKNYYNWLVWWVVDEEELATQVEGYENLGMWKSARKVSAGFLLLSVVVTIGFVVFSLTQVTAVIDAVILLVLAILVWKGKKWAMIVAMVMWTLERGFSLVGGLTSGNGLGASPITAVIWWCTYMHEFYLAWQVERRRGQAGQSSLGMVTPAPAMPAAGGIAAVPGQVGGSVGVGAMPGVSVAQTGMVGTIPTTSPAGAATQQPVEPTPGQPMMTTPGIGSQMNPPQVMPGQQMSPAGATIPPVQPRVPPPSMPGVNPLVAGMPPVPKATTSFPGLPQPEVIPPEYLKPTGTNTNSLPEDASRIVMPPAPIVG